MVVGTQLPLGAGPRTFGLPRWVISGSAVNGDTRPVQSKTHAAEAQTNSCATSNQAVTVSPRANAIPQVPFGETHCAGRPVPPSLIPSSRNRFIAQSWHCVDGKARASGGGFRGLGCAKAPVAGPLPGMDPRELRGHYAPGGRCPPQPTHGWSTTRPVAVDAQAPASDVDGVAPGLSPSAPVLVRDSRQRTPDVSMYTTDRSSTPEAAPEAHSREPGRALVPLMIAVAGVTTLVWIAALVVLAGWLLAALV
jgi:hypothetical protein